MKDYSKVLQRKIRDTVNAYAREVKVRVKEEWSRYESDLGKAKITVTPALIKADTEGMIVQAIHATGQKAWLLEYGRGSLMETRSAENPWLDEYVSSKQFNKWRMANAFAITGREKGSQYYDLDGRGRDGVVHGVPFVSTGTLKGVNLEKDWHSTKSYTPLPPRRIIQTILFGDGDNGLLHELREALAECVAQVYMEMIDEYADMEIEFKL